MGATFSRRAAILAAPLGLGLARSASAQGEAYPNRPVRLIVPYGAGTATDLLARQCAPKIGDALGQRLVVENRAGAGGIVGAETVARAAPDGYTLGFAGSQTHAINVSLYRTLPYDPLRDFTPIARLANQPMVLVVHPDLPARNVAALVALAKARPGTLNFASTGNGTSAHLSGEALRTAAGIDIVHVPYSTGAQVFTELLAGRTQFMFYPYLPLKPHIDTGRVIPIATTGETRPAWLSQVPTMIESGFPDFIVVPWMAIFGPPGLPAPIAGVVTQACRRSVDDAELRATLASTGTEAYYADAAQLGAFTRAEIERYRRVIAASGARVD
jgi:tripartite-type tricarboxylate transporter receptor subunit TctC